MEEESKQPSPPFKKSPIRFIIPILGCIILFGDAYSFNIPQPLQV